MSTIASTVQMNDAMSPVINGITNALNICISSFGAMQSASGHSIDTASLDTARQHLASAGASFGQIEQNINNAGNGQEHFNNKVVQGQSSMDGLISKAKTLAEAYLGFEAIKKAIDISDEMTQINARLGIMNYGLQSNVELQDKIFQSAQRSRASYMNTAEAIAKMGLNARMAFSSNDELIAFMEQINKQFVIGGASVEETKNAMVQLTQAMASGALRGEDLNSILAAAPEIARAIEKSMNWKEGSIKQYAEKGLVTADVVKKAMFKTAEETEQRFNSMPKTFAQSMEMMKNQALMDFKPISQEISNLVNNANFMNFINILLSGFALITIGVLDIINIVADVGTFIQSNWGLIEPVIWGIIAALIVYNAALLISNTLAGEGVIAMVAKTIADWAETAALIAMTFAQEGLNAALALCPITWIIILIIALVVIFYTAIAAMNKFGGTSLSATGMIAGSFAMLGAAIYNVIAFVWNIISSLVEFIANVFKNPVYSVQKLFVNLATDVLDVCIAMTSGFDQFATNMANAIIKGINVAMEAWNKFVDLLNEAGIADKLGIGKATELNYTTSITSDLQNMKGNLNNSLGEVPTDYWTAPKMDMKSYGGSFDWGYSKGAGAEAWASNLLNPQQQDTGQGYDYDQLLKNTGDTAANTGKTKDKLDITSEDLKYLRDIADRDTINRFTTAEVKVDMTNHNTVNSELDLDGIMNNLVGSVKEGLVQVREGATYEL
jgi:tape measure domain-containing protein